MFLKILKWITRIFQYVSYASISVLTILTVVDVVRRFIFSRTLTGVTEWSQMLLIVSMTAMAHALVEGRFINVGVLVDRFPKKVNLAFEVFMGAVSFAFFFVVGYQLIGQIESSIRFREAYFMLGTPRWPFYGILGVAFLACALGTVVFVIERILNFKAPGDKDVFDENPDLAILAFSDYKHDKEGGAE